MKKELLSIGFDEKEAEIYLALSRLGKSNVAQLVKITKVERRTIYDVLERLIQKGWVSYHEENRKKHYSPVKPEVILENLRKKERDFEKTISKINSLKKDNSEAKVEILKGKKGLRTIFFEIINSKEVHYSFGDITPFISDEEYKPLVDDFLEYLESREIRERVIYPRGEPVKKISFGKYKALDKKFIPPTPTIIFGNITIQFVFGDPLTIIKITSKEIAETNKKYFETFWTMK